MPIAECFTCRRMRRKNALKRIRSRSGNCIFGAIKSIKKTTAQYRSNTWWSGGSNAVQWKNCNFGEIPRNFQDYLLSSPPLPFFKNFINYWTIPSNPFKLGTEYQLASRAVVIVFSSPTNFLTILWFFLLFGHPRYFSEITEIWSGMKADWRGRGLMQFPNITPHGTLSS